jgi:hypothetical protein
VIAAQRGRNKFWGRNIFNKNTPLQNHNVVRWSDTQMMLNMGTGNTINKLWVHEMAKRVVKHFTDNKEYDFSCPATEHL